MTPRPYLRVRDQANGQAASLSWNPRDLCAAYNWPSNLRGAGRIGLIELGGGWNPDDLALFCRINALPVPLVTDRLVNGAARGVFGADPGSDGEVALDLQVAAAACSIATGRPALISTYYCANEIAAIADGVRAATADGCDVISISWGSDEALWPTAMLLDLEAAIAAAVAAGTAVFAAAGDDDSSDGGPDPANVDAPAACPSAIACGGTARFRNGREIVWNNDPGKTNGSGTEGGFSRVWPAPAWQFGQSRPGRMVPDVAANADPDTGYNIVMNGAVTSVGGTSAVAPLYAGLFAAFGTKLGAIGPRMWRKPLLFRDVTIGDNGFFHATVGPDPCTGLGAPDGTRLALEFA